MGGRSASSVPNCPYILTDFLFGLATAPLAATGIIHSTLEARAERTDGWSTTEKGITLTAAADAAADDDDDAAGGDCQIKNWDM
jgi:hypothetical protein